MVLFIGVLGPFLGLLALLYVAFYVARRGFDLAEGGITIQRYLPPTFWIALTGIIILTAISITMFEIIANSYRFTGPTSQPLPEDERAAFLAHSRCAFFAMYASIILVSGIVGFLLQRWVVREGRVTSVALILSVVLTLILSFPNVEYWNSCYVGESFVIEHTRRCS